MPTSKTKPSQPPAPPITQIAEYFLDTHLVSKNRSPRTIQTYGEGIRLFAQYLADQNLPHEVTRIQREHIEGFVKDLLGRFKPATASNRQRALQAFFKYCAQVLQVIDRSPMEGMELPTIPDDPPDVLTEDQERRLLKACSGRDFASVRDAAIVRFLIATPMRREELAGLTLDDVDRKQRVATVLGKGGRHRPVPFTPKVSDALVRYLLARAGHPHHESTALWLGPKGPLTGNGIYQMVVRRAEQAGLGRIYVHLFRHTFAHQWLDADGSESDLMRLAGWHSPQMLRRYGRSAASARARNSYERLRPGDNV
jgi:site-specific recombinase XerD